MPCSFITETSMNWG